MSQGIRLSEEQVAQVGEAFQTTPHWRAAANYAGVNESTVHDYRRRAENYAKRFPDLHDETDPDYYCWTAVRYWTEVRSQLEQRCAQGILDAGPKDWKAYHTILKALAPQDWSDRVELTGAGGGPVQISTDEARAQLEISLAAVKAKREAAGSVVDGEALDAATTIEEVEAAVAIPPPTGG